MLLAYSLKVFCDASHIPGAVELSVISDGESEGRSTEAGEALAAAAAGDSAVAVRTLIHSQETTIISRPK